MPYDGNGNFIRAHNWTADAANALDINATEMDAEDNGFAAGLSNAVTRDGQGKMSVDFLPNVDNVLNLGSASFRWASINGVQIPSGNNPFTFYPRTAAEVLAGITPTVTSYPANVPYYDTRRTGAVTDNSTDNTTAVLNAIKGLNGTTTQGGGIVFNPKNSKFNLSALSGLPARFELWYYGGDDTSDSTVVGTNELRCFIANANASGIVNERRIEGAFNPAQVINVRKNITGQDPWLGAGQSRTNPARATFAIKDEDNDGLSILYQTFAAQSNFSGWSIFSVRRTYTLNGITNTSFAGGAPAANATLTGQTSGATGFVVSSDASKVVVIWIGGKFVAGESVSDGTHVSSTTISSAVFAETNSASLSLGLLANGWSIGLPNDLTTYPLAVGGPIGIQATRTMSQYIPVTYASPYFELVDSYENSPPNGFQLFYNTAPAAASRRLTLRKYNTTTDIAAIGAVRAYGGFSDAGSINTSSFNLASITKNGTGDYTVNFTTAFARADYAVVATSSNGVPVIAAQTTSSVRIQLQTNGVPGTLVNTTVGINVICLGGDI